MKDEQDAKRQKLVVESYSSTENLPDELVIEILCRFPDYKYVFQCKCISKHWLSLISSPYFIRSFIATANNKMKIKEPVVQPWAFAYFKSMVERLYKCSDLSSDYSSYETDGKEASTKLNLISPYSDTSKSNELSLEFLPCYRGEDEPFITVLKTYNDLILCCEEKFDKNESCAYYICNPHTKHWVALPPTPPHDGCKCIEVEFICEPYYRTDHKGMVILNSQYKFKVLRFLCGYSTEKIRLQIFSSKTRQWDMTQISMPSNSPISFTLRSFLFKDNVSLISISRGHIQRFKLSVIMLDHHLNQSVHKLVYFPGSRFCRNPFHSIMHLSLRFERFYVIQIYVNVDPSQPDYGVPILLISRLNESVTKWNLRHRVSFREMTSPNKWISDVYLKGTFAVKENEKQKCRMPIVLGFHPYYCSVLYLNLNCESDNSIVFYNTKKRSLDFASNYRQWRHSSFPRYQLICGCGNLWSAVSQIVLPSWPTPIPQISLSQSQEAVQPICQS